MWLPLNGRNLRMIPWLTASRSAGDRTAIRGEHWKKTALLASSHIGVGESASENFQTGAHAGTLTRSFRVVSLAFAHDPRAELFRPLERPARSGRSIDSL